MNEAALKPRLAKELRPLLLPWSTAVIAGLVIALRLRFNHDTDPWDSVVVGVAWFGGVAALVILCSSVFGTEFQHTTFALLLSQPLSRQRLWIEKLLVLAAAVLSAVFCAWLILFIVATTDLSIAPGEALVFAAFVVATITSSGFWTMIARSTIGGSVFCFGSQFVVAVLASFVCRGLFGNDTPSYHAKIGLVLTATMFTYAAVFLWLGWRTFSKLEIRDVYVGQASLPAKTRFLSVAWLRSEPKRPLLNLVRKELRLNKSIFLVAVTFSVCWFAVLAFHWIAPPEYERTEIILNLMSAFYVPLVMILAGCVSLSEERSLGLSTWHLTLPVQARAQWFIKIAVGGILAVGLGLVLPLFLSALPIPGGNIGLVSLFRNQNAEAWPVLLLGSLAVFITSYWAASMLGNAVRAALATILVLPALFGCVLGGVWCGQHFAIQAPLLGNLAAYLDLPPNFFASILSVPGLSPLLGGLTLVALIQSFRQFRLAQPRRLVMVKYSLILVCLTFLLAFWVADFAVSASEQWRSRLVGEIRSALRVIPAEQLAETQQFSPEDLVRTGKLSRTCLAWLKNGSVRLWPMPPRGQDTSGRRLYTVEIILPDDTRFSFIYETPAAFRYYRTR